MIHRWQGFLLFQESAGPGGDAHNGESSSSSSESSSESDAEGPGAEEAPAPEATGPTEPTPAAMPAVVAMPPAPADAAVSAERPAEPKRPAGPGMVDHVACVCFLMSQLYMFNRMGLTFKQWFFWYDICHCFRKTLICDTSPVAVILCCLQLWKPSWGGLYPTILQPITRLLIYNIYLAGGYQADVTVRAPYRSRPSLCCPCKWAAWKHRWFFGEQTGRSAAALGEVGG